MATTTNGAVNQFKALTESRVNRLSNVEDTTTSLEGGRYQCLVLVDRLLRVVQTRNNEMSIESRTSFRVGFGLMEKSESERLC
jgi:hypothetical protein